MNKKNMILLALVSLGVLHHATAGWGSVRSRLQGILSVIKRHNRIIGIATTTTAAAHCIDPHETEIRGYNLNVQGDIQGKTFQIQADRVRLIRTRPFSWQPTVALGYEDPSSKTWQLKQLSLVGDFSVEEKPYIHKENDKDVHTAKLWHPDALNGSGSITGSTLEISKKRLSIFERVRYGTPVLLRVARQAIDRTSWLMFGRSTGSIGHTVSSALNAVARD